MTATRREVLRGSAVAGVTLVSGSLLAACGGSDSGSAGSTPQNAATPPAGAASGGAAAGAAAVITTLAKVPVGGGVILLDAKESVGEPLVVAQPSAGTLKAFSAVCTHTGCPVSEIVGQSINCKCHGSEFSLADGSVVKGPATAPLKEFAVKLDGDNVIKA